METETKERIKLPEFHGKPLIEIPKIIPSANFLEGDFGKAVLEEYKGRAEADYKDASALKVLFYDNGVVKGSTPSAVILVNDIVRQEGLRTATQADLERVLRTKALQLRGQYEDSALVLRSEDEPNAYLAKYLMAQIKARNPKQKMPVMIPLSGLELEVDENSPHGLAFKLRDDAEIIYAPILNENSDYFSSEDIDESIGLPKKLGEGDRYLCTRNSDLSRLGLDNDLYLYSDYDSLAYSIAVGSVVVVSGEATS